MSAPAPGPNGMMKRTGRCGQLCAGAGDGASRARLPRIPAATAAIDDQAWLKDNKAKVIATRTRLTEGLQKLGFAPVPSQANFVWAPHPGVPVKPLYEQLKARQILVRYMNYPGWGDGLRISVGSDDQIDACLSVLKSIV